MKSIYIYLYNNENQYYLFKYRNFKSQNISQIKHTCRCKYIHCIMYLHNDLIGLTESYLHIPQPEIRTIVRATGNNVCAIWAPGNIGHPIGMVLKSLLNSQLICWLKHKPTCLKFCACFLVTSYNIEAEYSQKCWKEIVASEMSFKCFFSWS